MDKLLLTAFLTALAGFITFVLSVVKLVNEKESTTTGYRQAWTDSARTCLAGLVAKLNATASVAANHRAIIDARYDLQQPPEGSEDEYKRFKDFAEANLKSSLDIRRQLRKDTYEAYALARLHFKPNDISFSRIEQKFDIAMALIELLDDEADKEKRANLKGKIHAEVNEITGYCRDILKTEWETVKRGEPTYQKTKLYSIIGGILTLFVLVSIGAYAGIAAIRGDRFANSESLNLTEARTPSKSMSESREKLTLIPNCSSIDINITNSAQGAPVSRTSPSLRPNCEPTK